MDLSAWTRTIREAWRKTTVANKLMAASSALAASAAVASAVAAAYSVRAANESLKITAAQFNDSQKSYVVLSHPTLQRADSKIEATLDANVIGKAPVRILAAPSRLQKFEAQLDREQLSRFMLFNPLVGEPREPNEIAGGYSFVMFPEIAASDGYVYYLTAAVDYVDAQGTTHRTEFCEFGREPFHKMLTCPTFTNLK